MSPILSIELATTRRADLLRAAESYRRAAAAKEHRRSRLARLSDRAVHIVERLRRPASTTVCCA